MDFIEAKGEDKRHVRYRLPKEYARVDNDGTIVPLTNNPLKRIKPVPLNRFERRRREAAERTVRAEIDGGATLPEGMTEADCFFSARVFALTIEDFRLYESA